MKMRLGTRILKTPSGTQKKRNRRRRIYISRATLRAGGGGEPVEETSKPYARGRGCAVEADDEKENRTQRAERQGSREGNLECNT